MIGIIDYGMGNLGSITNERTFQSASVLLSEIGLYLAFLL